MTDSYRRRRHLSILHAATLGLLRRILSACLGRMLAEANSRKTTSLIGNFTTLDAAEDDEDAVYYDARTWSVDEFRQTRHDSGCDQRRKISWGTVQVRTFPNIVGDNPEARGSGPPVRKHYDVGEMILTGFKKFRG